MACDKCSLNIGLYSVNPSYLYGFMRYGNKEYASSARIIKGAST